MSILYIAAAVIVGIVVILLMVYFNTGDAGSPTHSEMCTHCYGSGKFPIGTENLCLFCNGVGFKFTADDGEDES